MTRLGGHFSHSRLAPALAVMRSRRTKKIGIGVAGFLGFLGLAGFFAAPPLIRHVAEQQISAALHRPTTIGHIAFNPYTLRLEVDDLHIGDRDGQGRFVDMGQIVVRASWTSLVRFAPVVDEIKIVRPHIALVRTDLQHFNFSDLLEPPADAPKEPPPPSGKPPRFALSNIQIEDGRIEFDDQPLKLKHVVDDWSVSVPFIASMASKSDVFVEPRLHARIDGSLLDLTGKTKPFADSLESAVSIKIDDLDVPRLLSYSPVPLPVAVDSGRLFTDLTVTFTMKGDTPNISLTGSVDLNNPAVFAPGHAPLFSAKSLHVAADRIEPLDNLIHFGDIRLDQPSVWIGREQDGQLNVQKLATSPSSSSPETPAAPAPAAPPPSANTAPPLDLALEHLALTDGTVHVTDAATEGAQPITLSNLSTTLSNFSLDGPTPASYSLSTSLSSGGGVSAEGTLSLHNHQARTRLNVDAVALPVIQPYLAAATPARLLSGAVDASLYVSADWSHDPLDLRVENSELALQNFALALPSASASAQTDKAKPAGKPQTAAASPTAGPAPALSTTRTTVKLTRLDLASRTAEIAGIASTGLGVNLTLLPNGQIDLAALAQPPASTAPKQANAKAVAPASTTKAKPAKGKNKQAAPAAATVDDAWHFRIDDLALQDSHVMFTDRTLPRPATIDLSPLQIEVKQISDDLSKPLTVQANIGLNKKSALDLSGDITPMPLKMALKINSNRLDVAAIGPYLHSLNATVASAFVNAKGDLSFEQAKRGLKAGYRGDVALVDVKVLDRVASDPLAGWKTLSVSGLKADYDDSRGVAVDVTKIAFANFYGQALLDSQGRLRIQDVLSQNAAQPDNGPSDKEHTTPAQAPSPTASAGAPAAAPAQPALPMTLRVGQVQLQNGRVTYADNFIKPHYTANLTAINGTVGTIATNAANPAPVDIRAQLATNGPITINGTINPLAEMPSLDLTAAAKSIELTNLTPYSAKYAGYPITKGKLSVDLHYQLANNQLSANNHIFVDQLTFGDHIDNDTATHLPVRLAIALLKDDQGRIDVNIPVSGSLDNPDFSIGDVIFQAFLNLLERAVTSPFSLLANAFGGGGEDLGYVEFAPGTADLTDDSRKKLDSVSQMLSDRQSVSVDIIGRVDPETDLPGLRAVYVQKLVAREKLKDMVEDAGQSIDPDSVKVSPAEYSKYLTKVYRAADFKKPRNMLGLTKSLPDEDMAKALADHADVADSSLLELAQSRAQSVHQYLDGKIDPSRLFVVAPKLDAKDIQDKGSPNRVDFALK